MDILEYRLNLTEKIIRVVAMICIAGLEYQLVLTGQDGVFLLPVAFIIGLLAGVKLTDLAECITKK